MREWKIVCQMHCFGRPNKLVARSDHSHDSDKMLKVIMMMLQVIPNIFQVACGGNSLGNKPGCVSWQQGFFVSFD